MFHSQDNEDKLMSTKSKIKRFIKNGAEHKPRTTLNDMIVCPFCKAYSYPRLVTNPSNDEEKKQVYCGSCRQELSEYMKKLLEYQQKLEAEANEKVEEKVTGENEETSV
jgi:tRNA isopentenyl-2-thiomethyl-A-37 hydroxylase MiaE